jgi:hypothetical protein
MRDGPLGQFGPLGEPEGKDWHVFLSHSGAQKRGFVDFLLKEFNTRYPAVNVFVDEYSLNPGSDALKAMHIALSDAHVGASLLWPSCCCISHGDACSIKSHIHACVKMPSQRCLTCDS